MMPLDIFPFMLVLSNIAQAVSEHNVNPDIILRFECLLPEEEINNLTLSSTSNFNWYFNGNELNALSNADVHRHRGAKITFLNSNSILVLNNVSSNDLGEYTCHRGERGVFKFNLKHGPYVCIPVLLPRWNPFKFRFILTTKMPVLRYTEGDTVTLNCKKRSNNSGLHHQFLRPVKYYWYKRFAVLYLNETVNKLRHKWNSSSPLFQLKDLSLFESATYTCKVVDENVVIEHEFTVVVSKETNFHPRVAKSRVGDGNLKKHDGGDIPLIVGIPISVIFITLVVLMVLLKRFYFNDATDAKQPNENQTFPVTQTLTCSRDFNGEKINHHHHHQPRPKKKRSLIVEFQDGKVWLSTSKVHKYQLDFKEWEVDKKTLNISEVLGEGTFGTVYKGTTIEGLERNNSVHKTVAVKMIKGNFKNDLLIELAMLKHIGHHENIVNFLGFCTQSEPIYVIVEFVSNGNLRDFLQQHGQKIGSLLVTTANLTSFALQIATGLEFLASKNCIHRDLAARNVLVTEDYVMKIADFGLARSVDEIDYYRKMTRGPLPVKWMAIESLMDRIFTKQSDVWSFGILLWEIFSLGGSPYPSVAVQNLFKLLKSGYRMQRPKRCPQQIYEIILTCWSENAANRPTFTDLVDIFENLTNKPQGYQHSLSNSTTTTTTATTTNLGKQIVKITKAMDVDSGTDYTAFDDDISSGNERDYYSGLSLLYGI